MTAYFSYIGQATGKTVQGRDFEWENPPEHSRNSNLPPRLVPKNALYNIGTSVHWIMEQANAGRYQAKPLDWGAWGVKMTGAELRDFYGPDHDYAEEIAALDADESYILVAGELW